MKNIYKDPVSYVSHNRLDVILKLLYLELKSVSPEYARKIYLNHIAAFSLGKFTEPGNREKMGKERFIADFDTLAEDIKKYGFDSKKGKIPIAIDNTILNGSHRLAASIHNGLKEISVKPSRLEPVNYDFNFFMNRKVEYEDLNLALLKYIEIKKNIRLALIWPRCDIHKKEIVKWFPNYIHILEKESHFNFLRNLILQTYQGQAWLGGYKDKYRGGLTKTNSCFREHSNLRIVIFEVDKFQNVNQLKENFRNKYGLGKNSIHITDELEETLRISNLVLNENALLFLKQAKVPDLNKINDKLNKLKIFLDKIKFNYKDLVVSGSFLLEMSGIRSSSDLDLISRYPINLEDSPYDSHNDKIVYFQKSIEDLVYNPRQYFIFDSIKVISVNNLINLKQNRLESKDKIDLIELKKLFQVSKNYKTYKISKSVKFIYLRLKIYLSQFILKIFDFLRVTRYLVNLKRQFKKSR